MDVALVILPRETSGGGVHCTTAVIFSCFLPYLWNCNSSTSKRSNSTHARILPFLSPLTYISQPVLICSLFRVADGSLAQDGAMYPVISHCNITLMNCLFLSAPMKSRFVVFESFVRIPKRDRIIYTIFILCVMIRSHNTPPSWI
jgi:hypothetical protein